MLNSNWLGTIYQLATWHCVILRLKQYKVSRIQVAQLKLEKIDRNFKCHTKHNIHGTNSIHTQINFKDPLSSFIYVHCMHLITSHKICQGFEPLSMRALPIAKQMVYTQMKHVRPRPLIQEFARFHSCCKHT